MSLRSDQASDRASYTASAPPAPATAFTATFWARLRVDRDDFSTMMRLHSSSGGTTTVTVASNSSGTVPAVFSPGNTGGIVGSDALVVDQWRMVAVTISGTGASGGRMYTRTVGGSTNMTTGQVSGGSTPDGITLFGRSPSDSSEWFNGSLAHVRVWSAVLSQSEIEAEWNSTTPVRTTNLWASWPLTTDLTDTSGNGRALSAGTTALTVEDDPPISGGTNVTGSGAAAFGALTGTAAGTRGVAGAAAASLGGLTAAAAGVRSVTGTAAAQFGALVATAAAPTLVTGSATAAFGGLTGTARGTQPGAQQGSWQGLVDILREAADIQREELQQDPVACLDCGEPLRSGPRGEKYCPFDGQIWAAGNRLVGTVAGRR
ncbi:LamG-like jellyroll fold domain-containing protein [Streptomyces griseoincarnatus]